jgi:hypothetical protein
MDLDELQGLALPCQCKCSGKKPGKCMSKGKKPKDGRGAGMGPPPDGSGS